ncbi:hypothetical protein FPQ18DRAFT_387772 [Pyronema domesticum]|uniref:Uncharacterized protein n=1 Tax=Pyronema omphalodes (strain CBS 100304) TaxID=1076935 RepID=U4LCT7_PYROM|nr:hypothetical protein FPQ18DRAFT_387772 [Pyronema domesticum]CCX12233.1 Protein of unknown function [Pyronema omphalodes CBS 100304]
MVGLDGELKVLRRYADLGLGSTVAYRYGKNFTVAYIEDEKTFGQFFGRIAAHRVLKDDVGVVALNMIDVDTITPDQQTSADDDGNLDGFL